MPTLPQSQNFEHVVSGLKNLILPQKLKCRNPYLRIAFF